MELMRWAFSLPDRLLFNARSEGIEKAKFWADSFQKRRCIIPASAIQEAQDLPDGKTSALIWQSKRGFWRARLRWTRQLDFTVCLIRKKNMTPPQDDVWRSEDYDDEPRSNGNLVSIPFSRSARLGRLISASLPLNQHRTMVGIQYDSTPVNSAKKFLIEFFSIPFARL